MRAYIESLFILVYFEYTNILMFKVCILNYIYVYIFKVTQVLVSFEYMYYNYVYYNNCERRELPSQSYGRPKNEIKSLILVVEQFCIKHFLILF